jgi:serine/threonine protein kinase
MSATDGPPASGSFPQIAPAAAALVGTVLDGRYRIIKLIGEGGMGEVYSAEHVHIDKKFAIKLLKQEIVSNAEAVPVDAMPRAGAVEQARRGAGAADAPRRELTEADVRLIVGAEVAEHDRAAQHLAAVGRPDDAARVTAEADVLRELLAGTR